MSPASRTFNDKRYLAGALAEAVAANLKAGIAGGQASAAVSVGATPVNFFHAPSRRDGVAWDKVTVPRPLDAVVLGMGNDGHTASFFPGDTLSEALTAEGPVIAIRAPGAGEPRVTLALAQGLAAKALYLHIEGEEKVETPRTAEAEGPIEAMPVRAILRQTSTPLTIYWCP